MTNNIYVTEITASGDGHYMMASIDGVEYKVKHDNPCTWENRDNAFQELLELIPESDRPAVEAEYDKYCEGLRNAEAEAERLANMTDEERIALFKAQMEEYNEEVHEEIQD